MEFLKSSKRRSVISELVYIVLNVALAIVILGVVWAIESPLPAFVLVLLSKWRVLAVRPRYWFANIQANLVDIIVSLSVVVLLYAASDALVVQIVLTLLYIVWLLFVKPRSKRTFVAIQAGTALFLGVTALMSVSFEWPSSLVVLLMWVIGYSAARHVLGSYDEVHSAFYSLVWGLVIAELGWLMYHWTFAYALPGLGDIKLSQTAIIVLAVSFLTERVYSSATQHGSVRSGDIILPTLLSVSLILVLLLFFNTISSGTI
ncbi:hypothetical protein PV379_02530 [Streptomyces caniscabiei]|uniref:hypothetical protein n=1 Tax=Streptomyces caniscabiei TaxID=2746961 RepID=UPI0029BDEA5D|nr:hypothetical protein [Streptomyces caniscabiei]MDX2776231.1 hypothetical protein [Streptomyces caniscabiei]